MRFNDGDLLELIRMNRVVQFINIRQWSLFMSKTLAIYLYKYFLNRKENHPKTSVYHRI